MRTLVISAVLLFSQFSFAAFDGANVDLVKFRKDASKALEDQGLPSQISDTQFQDAAFAVDTPTLFDGAMLWALGREVQLREGANNSYRLAYRLMLGTGKTSVVLANLGNNTVQVVVPESLFVIFPRFTPREYIESASKKLEEQLGTEKYSFSVLGSVKRIAIDFKEQTVANLLELIAKTDKLDKDIQIGFVFEKYRTEFNFGKIQSLNFQESADLDKLRDVVSKYVAQGKVFAHSQSNCGIYLIR